MKKLFSLQSPNLWVNILNLVLSVIAIAGVELPQNPNSLSLDIVNTLNTSGVIAVLGLVFVNVASPIYHAVIKNKFSLKNVLASSNFYIQAGTLALAALAYWGLYLPDGTVEQVVGYIFAKDYGSLLGVLFLNVFNPLIRFLKDRKAQGAPAVG